MCTTTVVYETVSQEGSVPAATVLRLALSTPLGSDAGTASVHPRVPDLWGAAPARLGHTASDLEVLGALLAAWGEHTVGNASFPEF